MVYRGDLLDLKWIPDEAASLKLECLKLIDMKLYMGKYFLNSVPPQIFSILSLKQLDMSQNGLYSIRGIGSLVNITDLDLSGNCLEYLPDELCNLTSLAFINVSKNYLTNRSIPQGLFEKSFNTVDVSENQLAKLSPEFLQCFIKSESVIIHSNPWENAELAKITADSSEEAVKQTLQSLIPAIPAKRASVQSLKDLSPTNNSAGDLIEPIKQTPPTGAKPPVVRPRGEAHKDEASPTKDESHLSPSQNSKPPLVKPKLSESGSAEPPTQEETPASKAPPLKPKPNEKDAEEEGLASPKPPVFKSKSEVVMGSKEKEHEAAKLASSKAEVDPTGAAANVSDLSKKIGMSIPTKPYGRGRSDSIPSSVPGTPHEEHKVDTFPTIESHESKATPPPSSSGIGSMFKNFSSKMRGNTNAPKPAETVIQPPERTAAPLKTMTRAAGPKGRKAATIDQITGFNLI